MKEESIREASLIEESLKQLSDPEVEEIVTEPSIEIVESAKVAQETFIVEIDTDHSNEIV